MDDVGVLERHLLIRTLDVYRTTSIGFTDCLILAVARKAGHLPLGTFDKRLSRLEGAQRL